MREIRTDRRTRKRERCFVMPPLRPARPQLPAVDRLPASLEPGDRPYSSQWWLKRWIDQEAARQEERRMWMMLYYRPW